ncbi:glycosyltransferase [Thiospirochaeta perfilievii]|uniref:Glycosyltransferase n=1 Tax=Thiospirochaeta perfilievii TaxID=252967 RepID=A0A5C1QF28_9SPIO|nr:glycosyltransferase family 2 protein [Thiospirochaeta perfilievii]QEN05690.1 glycosyltransferase [Thiospirochaeta perfilievii]
MKVSIIIPCYNEEEVISLAYQRIYKVMERISYQYEIVLVNDGSKDNTYNILKEISSKNDTVKVINLSRNFGHQPAVTAGIELCSGDIAIIMDADMQDPPELIPDMIDVYLKEEANVVYAVRESRKGESFFKKVTAKLFYRFLNSVSEIKLPLDTGDFRLIDRSVIEEFKKLKEKKTYIRGLITWVGYKQVPFYYKRDQRLAGETKYPLSKMLKFASNGIMSFTKKPLEIAIGLGTLNIIVGIILSVYVFISHFSNSITTVPGWASLMIVVIFFSGIQLLSLGFIGIYLGRVFDEVKDRPDYIISEKINF